VPPEPAGERTPPKTEASTLEETIALLEATLEATLDAILVIDLTGRAVRWNLKYLAMFGLTAEQVERDGRQAIAPALEEQLEDPGPLLANTEEILREPPRRALETLRFKDGRVVERFVAPHKVGGAIVGLVESYRDVSAAVQAAQALEENRALIERSQEIAHLGSWVAELDASRSLRWSNETCRIFGVPPGQFAGTTEAFFDFVHPDDREAVAQLAAAARAGTAQYDIEHRIVRNDAEVRWVHERADIVRAADGTAVRMVGTVQDVSDRRVLQDRLRESQKLEAIGRLAGGVAHDMNNALTAIIGYTELVAGALGEADPVRADVLEIRRAAERAEAVTRHLLAFSRKQLLEPRVFSLNDTIANLARMLGRTLGAGIELVTVPDPSVPPIFGDPGQIEQAILNLAVNARDAMPDGGQLALTVASIDLDEAFVSTHKPMAPGRYVQLSIRDTGHGMDAETQQRIFEPFFTTKDPGKGTGLGLAMVYGTVKQSGGFIFVESSIGEGTTFRLYFPPAPVQQPSDARAPAAPLPARTGTVLVAEDEAAVRNLVVTALAKTGYRVLPAASGDEALALAAAEGGPIDLLLTDANMPGMTGIDLATALVAARPGMPVVIMSGYTDQQLSIADIPATVSLLPKPFTPRDLRQKVADVLHRPEP